MAAGKFYTGTPKNKNDGSVDDDDFEDIDIPQINKVLSPPAKSKAVIIPQHVSDVKSPKADKETNSTSSTKPNGLSSEGHQEFLVNLSERQTIKCSGVCVVREKERKK